MPDLPLTPDEQAVVGALDPAAVMCLSERKPCRSCMAAAVLAALDLPGRDRRTAAHVLRRAAHEMDGWAEHTAKAIAISVPSGVEPLRARLQAEHDVAAVLREMADRVDAGHLGWPWIPNPNNATDPPQEAEHG